MAQNMTMTRDRKHEARHPSLAETTGDPVLDLLACSIAAAFDEASGDTGPTAHNARAYLVDTLSPESLARLRQLNLISW